MLFFRVECTIGLRRLVQRKPMRDDERWIDVSALDPFQQQRHVFGYVCLSHLKCQTFGERGPDWKFVNQSAVYSGDRNRACFAAGLNRLAECVRTVRLETNR